MDYKDIIKKLADTLPPVFRRKDLSKLTGGIISESYLRCLPEDAPKPAYTKFGKFVVYDKDIFLKWMEDFYGQFTEYTDPRFFGVKTRRVTGAEGETGSGCERN